MLAVSIVGICNTVDLSYSLIKSVFYVNNSLADYLISGFICLYLREVSKPSNELF